MSDSDVIGVVLAAGRGNRMYPFSQTYPKPLLPVCNKPLVQYQLEAMASLGVRQVIVVIGHLGYELSRELGDGSRFGISIEYHEQEDILGIAHAVGQLESRVNSPFFLFLGDIFFEFQNLGRMLEEMREKQAAAILAVRDEKDPELVRKNFTVALNTDGFVSRVIEKPRYTKSRLKGCGLYLFDLPIFDAIRRTPRTAMRNEYEITDSIQILIDDGARVCVSHCVSWDMNLTFPGDLLECNLRQLAETGQVNVIHEKAHVHPGARLQHTVVGSDADIAIPLPISNSVVFPNTRILSQSPLDRVVVTPERIIDCRRFEATART